jgi:hypothetical protein
MFMLRRLADEKTEIVRLLSSGRLGEWRRGLS